MLTTIDDYVIITDDTPPQRKFIDQDGFYRRGYIAQWLNRNPITNWWGGIFIEDSGVEWRVTCWDNRMSEMVPIDKMIFERIVENKKCALATGVKHEEMAG
jgi:hypothetical protein